MDVLNLLSIAIFLFPFINDWADDPKPFPMLKKAVIDDPYFQPDIYYDPTITTIINKRVENIDPVEVLVLITKLDRKKDQEYEIRYSEGFSGDPVFFILKKGSEELYRALGGTELSIPGDGIVYVSGHTNNLFNERRKLIQKGDELVEVKQPFYYVGLDTKTVSDIIIYSDKTLSTPVATIPAGGKLSVILNEGDFFLIKTPFGLLGWIQYESGGPLDYKIEGLFFNGD